MCGVPARAQSMTLFGSLKEVASVSAGFLLGWIAVLLVELNVSVRSEILQALYGACIIGAWFGLHWASRKSLSEQKSATQLLILELKIAGVLVALLSASVIFLINLKFFLGGSL